MTSDILVQYKTLSKKRGTPMKKKLLTSIVALLSLAALANDTAGNIYGIWPWRHVADTSSATETSGVWSNPYVYSTSYASGTGAYDAPITGGKFYFVVRLLNSGWSTDASNTVPWDFPSYTNIIDHTVHHPGSSTWAVQWVLNPPKFGITVGGRVAWAQIEDIFPDTYINSSSSSSRLYTDIVCSYTVKNSDLALPVCLANVNGEPVTTGPAYNILNQNKWVFFDTNRVNTVVFDFVSATTTFPKPDSSSDNDGRKNYDLSRSRINVKTLDFAETSYDVPLGDTRSSLVSVVINGTPEVGANESLGKLYAWPEDPTAVTVPGGEYEIEMDGTSSEYFIPVEGKTLGKSTKLVLSQFPRSVYTAWTNAITSTTFSIPAGETVLSTVLTATEPPANTLTVKPDSTTAEATGDRYTASTWLDISLLSNCTNAAPGLTVNLTPTLEGTYDSTLTWEDYIRLSDKESLTTLPAVGASKTNVLIQTGFQKPATSDRIYVYVLRSDDNNTKVKFVPDYADYRATTLELKAAPAVSSIQLSATGGLVKGKPVDFKVAMSDAYADENDATTGYSMTVTYDNGTETSSKQFNGLRLSGGMLRVLKGTSYVLPSDTMPLTGDSVTVTVTVVSPLSGLATTKTTTVSVSNFDVKATVDGTSEVACAEGDELQVTFTLPSTSEQDLYAFLVCTNQESAVAAKFTNTTFVVCGDTAAASTSGVKIPAGQPSNKGKFTVLDNTPDDDSTWFFDVVVCTTKAYSTAALYSDFTSTTLSLSPTNVPAAISSVVAYEYDPADTTKNAERNRAEPDASLGYVPEAMWRQFKVEVADTVYDCSTNMVVNWSVYRTNVSGSPFTNLTFKGSLADAGAMFKYKFPNAMENADYNRFYIKAEVYDKDTPAAASFVSINEITVQSKYSVTVSASAQTIYENDENAYISVGLKGWDSFFSDENGLTVKVDVVPYKLGLTKPGVLELDMPTVVTEGETNTYYVTFFSEGSQSLPIKPDTLDGTKESGGSSSGGYYVYASVTNSTVLPTSGQAADKYYKPFNASTQPQSVRVIKKLSNVAPSFVMTSTTVPNSETNAWKVAGSSATAISWEVTDCEADATEGLTIKFAGSIVNATNFVVTATNDTLSGTFTPDFGSLGGGTVPINISVEDKDGGKSETLTYWYEIQPAKFLTTAASGPSSGNSLIELSRLYRGQDGIGKGRTYVSGSGVSGDASAKGFKLLWNCGTAPSVKIWGYGYRQGDVEGSLANPGEGDIAVDISGNNLPATGGTPYTYSSTDLLDSFFYGWIVPTEAGGTEYTIAINPEDGFSVVGDGELNMPTELTDDETGYVSTYAEAIFAKEYRYMDNLGDINKDGVPDIFATKKYKNGALATADGTGSELVGLDVANDDGDYVPSSSQLGKTTLIPTAISGWETSGQAYNAMYEIRGYHEGLNYGMFKFSSAEYVADPTYVSGTLAPQYIWVSDLDLSENEKRSLIQSAIERRDEILNNRYHAQKAGKYDAADWPFVTNLLAQVIQAGTSRDSGTARRAYFTDYEVAAGTVPGATMTTLVLTNTVAGIDIVTTNLYCLTTYTDAADQVVTLTNIVETVTNIVTTGTTAVTNVFVTNPFDSITLDDINFGDFLSLRSAKPSLNAEQIAAKAYIDRTWHLYDETGKWGWTCENRTDPTVDDTDGDGLPDGYEYFLWYDAMIGANGTSRLVGSKFTLEDIESYENEISSDDIAGIYNPNVKRDWRYTDTDNDGIMDEEEFIIGTSPVHWDTDRDGVSDLYELMYNINPLSDGSGQNGAMNGDGDFMASAANLDDFEPYQYIYKATDGKLWALDTNDVARLRVAVAIDPTTNSVDVAGNGFEVVKLGSRYIPVTEDTANFIARNVALRNITVNPTVENDMVTNSVSLIHHQVHNYFGFDPRTAWYAHADGSLSTRGRWAEGGQILESGKPQNTVSYTAKDEYNLLKYRYAVGRRKIADDKKNLSDGKTTIQGILSSGCTNPNSDFESTTYSGDSELTFKQSQHGADTDGDGVPDGWELYIGVNPNIKFTIPKGDPGYDALYHDGNGIWGSISESSDWEDGLTLAYEYAGSDSCDAYSGCSTIYAFHPSQDEGIMKNWYNKFFPTDPRNADTDGDLIPDGMEGSDWGGNFTINRYGTTQVHSKVAKFFAIYGDPIDTGSQCIPGGGFNPGTVDTDQDGLPDPWERQYTGILFKDGEVSQEKPYKVFELGLPDPDFHDDIRAAVSACLASTNYLDGYHILMGMDGTVNDAYTETLVGSPDIDWDADGLQNWQEYMVQAMRHFRYDDDKTPLLGRDCSTVVITNATWNPGKWNGSDGFLKVSYLNAFSEKQLECLRDEFGYENFAEWALATPDYLGDLGYFVNPPRSWDIASTKLHNKYMLPRTSARAYIASDVPYVETTWQSVVIGGVTNLLYGYGAPGAGLVYTNDATHAVYLDPDGGYSGEVDIDGDGIDDTVDLFPLVTVVTNAATTLTYRSFEVFKQNGVPLYLGTDPRLWDTDKDGMDDYYELFHGLNPILGAVSVGGYDSNRDVIARAMLGNVTPLKNAWIGWKLDNTPVYDPVLYPWLMGVADCDADSDGLRNSEESILANVTSPGAAHTDPTPLWMTDPTVPTKSVTPYALVEVTSANGKPKWYPGSTPGTYVTHTNTVEYADEGEIEFALSPSYVALFYGNEVASSRVTYAASENSTVTRTMSLVEDWGCGGWDYLASFEQNEGYDTDNDWRSDGVELKNTAEGASDPQNFADPQRRQSVWFGGAGDEGMLLTASPVSRRYGGSDLFKQFTVEAWVRPEAPASGADQYVVSRAAYYPGSSLVNPGYDVRIDFALGIDATGKAFAEIMNSVDVSYRQTGSQLVAGDWVHLAASFDGKSFTIYINGEPARSMETTIIPANGTRMIIQDPQYIRMGSGQYTQTSSIIAIGARPTTSNAGNIDKLPGLSAWSDLAQDFFCGSVDEVRCWDGARTADEIKGDYRTRYTPAKVKAQRLEVFNAYINGGRRNDTKGSSALPPELVHHYDFTTLAGATAKGNVQRVPAGFETKVVNILTNPDTGAAIGNLVKIGWWNDIVTNTVVGSKVYTSSHVVPWVEDTVAHLPTLCGNIADSVYWSTGYAGYTPASRNSLEEYSFANTMNPYGVTLTYNEGTYLSNKLAGLSSSTNETENASPEESSLMSSDSDYSRRLYDVRRGFNGNSDLIPLGSAFAKRLDDSWDGQGSESPWATTTVAGNDGDPDDNGIPSWAEALGYTDPLDYLRQLAKGLLPGGSVNSAYSNREDIDADGMPDWWEKFYGIYSAGPDDDTDLDGLSNYQEYLIGEVYYDADPANFKRLSPKSAYSVPGNVVSDYFTRYKNVMYYGELFADHDMIEDWWEASQPAEIQVGEKRSANYSRYVYDANRDVMGVGRSNWANARVKVQGLDSLGVNNSSVTNYLTIVKEGSLSEIDAYYIQLAKKYGTDNVTKRSASSSNGGATYRTTFSIAVVNDVLTTSSSHLHQTIAATILYNGRDDSLKEFYNSAERSAKSGKVVVIKAWGPTANIDGNPDALWVVTADDLATGAMTVTLEEPVIGYLHDGANTFAAFLTELGKPDIDYLRDSIYTYSAQYSAGSITLPVQKANMPYGVVTGVEVSYLNGAPFALELTDTNPSIARIDVKNALVRQTVYSAEAAELNSDDESSLVDAKASCFAEVSQTCTDRGYWDPDSLASVYYIGTNTVSVTSNILVRVLRSAINGLDMDDAGHKFSSEKVLVSRDLAASGNGFLTEADLYACLKKGEGDIDWGGAVANFKANGKLWPTITNVAYRVVVYGGTVNGFEYNNNLSTMFINKFEKGSSQTAVTDKEMGTYCGQPTFMWKHKNSIGKAYPAFRLRVFDSDDDDATCIFDSGVQRAPTRDGNGRYSWTAPLWTGAMTASNVVFKADTTYYWAVSMLDAKFTDFSDDDLENKTPFAMQETSPSGDATDYGMIPVRVKYMGPGSSYIKTNKYKKCLRVEAFDKPDFVGVPFGVSYVASKTGLNDETTLDVNATITGLPADKTYYIRAFIDSDGDGKLDPWESWGYACYRGSDERRDFYTQRSFPVGNAVLADDCVVYIEDADTNCNQVPDIWEYENSGDLDATKSLSPYIAFTATTSRKKAGLDAVAGGSAGARLRLTSSADSESFAYEAALAAMASGSVTPEQLLLLGVDVSTVDSAHIKIASFSLETGITLEVVVDEGFEAAIAAGFETGTVKITVQYATTLEDGGNWKSAGDTVDVTFPLAAGTTEIPAEGLSAVNEAIESIRAAHGDGCYFRVSAVAVE